MSTNHKRPQCPVCGRKISRDTLTRSVRMERNLVNDEGFMVQVAKCINCKTEYEYLSPKSVPIILGGPKLLAMFLVTLLLSLIGGIVGVLLATQGANEFNPVLSFYMGHDPFYFFLVKYFLTAASLLLIILAGKRFESLQKFNTEQIMLGAKGIFAVCLVYDLIVLGLEGRSIFSGLSLLVI